MVSNDKNYLDYPGLQLFWEKAKDYFNTVVTEATENISELSNRVESIRITYDQATENIVELHEGTGKHGLEAEINLSQYAKKSDIAAALNFRGSKTVAEMEVLDGMARGDVYFVVAGGAKVDNPHFQVNSEYAWDGSSWVELGGVIDLSGYVTVSSLNTILEDYATVASLDNYVLQTALEETLRGYVTTGTFDALDARVEQAESDLNNIQELGDDEIMALFA